MFISLVAHPRIVPPPAGTVLDDSQPPRTPQRTYTKEEARAIVAGLASGRTTRRSMSDAEYRQRMDPRGQYESEMLAVLSDIKDAIQDRGDDHPVQKPRYSESRQTAPQKPSRNGGVPLN